MGNEATNLANEHAIGGNTIEAAANDGINEETIGGADEDVAIEGSYQ